MQLQDLYIKSINRPVNPAVSATKFDKETIDIEIKEYVFTDEILNGLYRILNAIKNNKPYDHVGISGFLKYFVRHRNGSNNRKALTVYFFWWIFFDFFSLDCWYYFVGLA